MCILFFHHCRDCQGFLHVPCGRTDENNNTICPQCTAKEDDAGASPTTLAASLTAAESTAAMSMAAVSMATSTASANSAKNVALPSKTSTMETLPKTAKQNAPPKTTSHMKQKKESGDIRIGIGKCMKIQWGQLYHILSSKEQRACLPYGVAQTYNYFGTVLGGGGTKTAKKGWDVCFDILPHDDNVIKNISRNKLSVLTPGKEEDPMNEQ